MQTEHGSGNSGRKPSWLTGRGILIAVMFLLGLGIFLYPHICDWYYQYQFNKAIAAYDRFQGIDCEGMIQEAREYNERLAKKEEQFLVPAEEREELDHLLDPWETGMMGYVDIPKIGVHVPIYHGTEERALQSGAGFWYGTSLPVGGENTHCVLAAHNGLVKAKLFTDLDKLEVGDRFTLDVLNETFTYEVDQILVTLPEETEELYVQNGKDLVTLYTCTPYGVNTHRLLVRGYRVTEPEE